MRSRIVFITALLSFGLALPSLEAAQRAVTASWEELPGLLQGREIETVLTDGVFLKGRVTAVSGEFMELEIRKSSDVAKVPKGLRQIPKNLFSSLKVGERKAKGRAILTPLMAIAGAAISWRVVAGEHFGEAAGAEGVAFAAGLTSGMGALGYYLGFLMDDQPITVTIKRP